MLDVAISQVTTPRWELPRELAGVVDHGFTSLAVWRPKLPDSGVAAAAAALAAAGLQASSLQGAGGFTGSDGRTFAESVADAVEAIEAAAILGTATSASRPPVLVLHAGCRGGHTRTHAMRLLHDALAALVPVARREGVVLALEPMHASAEPGRGFIAGLDGALEVVAVHDERTLGIALDLWHFGDEAGMVARLPRLASVAALVQVADRRGPPSPSGDRLPAGHGTLPLEDRVAALVRHGYRGRFEFDPVGENVEEIGYDAVLMNTRLVADAWADRLAASAEAVIRAGSAHDGGTVHAAGRRDHFCRAGAGLGSRRSQASSQVASRG